MNKQQLPNKTGYTFSFQAPDPLIPINGSNFTVTKFADNEAEALALIVEDVKGFLKILEDRQGIVGKVTLSPFAAIKK